MHAFFDICRNEAIFYSMTKTAGVTERKLQPFQKSFSPVEKVHSGYMIWILYKKNIIFIRIFVYSQKRTRKKSQVKEVMICTVCEEV